MPRLAFRAPADLPAAVAAARLALSGHGVIALPTETFYGLSVDPADGQAVARLFALKGRDADRRLLVIGANLEQLGELVEIAPEIRRWLDAVWPAPLSVVLPARRPLAAAGTTLAVRVPGHELLRELLARTGPLTSSSANRSGEPPARLLFPYILLMVLGILLIVLVLYLPGGVASLFDLWRGSRA